MAESLSPFWRRRARNFGIAAAAVVALLGLTWVGNGRLVSSSFASGWLLLLVVVALTLLNARKKLPFLPLGRASTWLQVHIYVGLFSLAAFGVHTGFRLPTGSLERLLAALFLGAAASGLVGLGLSRWVPRRLTAAGDELIYERIPVYRRELLERAEELIDQAVAEGRGSAIIGLFEDRLRPYLSRTTVPWTRLLHGTRKRDVLLADLQAFNRYLDAGGEELIRELSELIRRRDVLDEHLAGQSLLKYWLFVHVPLSYGLLVAALAHLLVTHGFSAASYLA